MATNQLEISFKIFLEAIDVKQSRIHSCTEFVKTLFRECSNKYFKGVEIDDECDMDEFILRLFVDHEVKEEVCTATEDADAFVLDMAEFLDGIAMEQAFLDMDGSFTYSFNGKKEEYEFKSESGQNYCDFKKKDE